MTICLSINGFMFQSNSYILGLWLWCSNVGGAINNIVAGWYDQTWSEGLQLLGGQRA